MRGVDTTQVMTETVEDKVSHSITGLDILNSCCGNCHMEPLQLKRRYLNESAVLKKNRENVDALATNDTVVLGTISTSNSASSTSLSAPESVHIRI